MKVVLMQDVPNLGKTGEIKEVADSYGRNYLLPKGYAALATKGLIKQAQERGEAQKKRDLKARSEAEQLAQRLNGQTIRFTVRVGELDRLYGSITNGDVAEKIQQQFSIDIDRRRIELGDPIKRAGVYSVAVRLSSGVEARLNVIVEGTDRNEAAASQAEAEFLHKINQGLPLDLGQRYSVLIAKRDAEELNPDEHEELLNLTDQVEQLEAQRVAYLVELARLRHTTVTDLIQELGIRPSEYV